jgi:hypothetical protein
MIGVESGVGVTARLVVNGTTHIGNGASNAGALFIDQGGTSSASRILQYDGGGAVKNLLSANGITYFTGGNVGIGATTAGARLDVRAQGALSTDIAFRVRNSADTINLVAVDGTGNITIGSSAIDNVLSFGGNNNQIFRSSADGSFNFKNTFSNVNVFRFRTNSDLPNANTSGTNTFMSLPIGFAPTSGTGTWTQLSLTATINQTGGANGITRGLFINPTLTSAADFRAIETTVGNVILGSTSGNVGIGINAPTKKLQLNVSASDDGILLSKAGSANSLFRVTMDGTNDRGEMFLNNGATIVMAIRQASNPSYINTGNNFGIGTSNPQARLDVRAQGALSTDVAFRVRNSADTANLMSVAGNGNSVINGSLRIVSTPSVGNITRPDDVGAAFQFGNGVNTAYGEFRWRDSGGTDLARLSGTGNLAIGSTTPNTSAKLDIQSTTQGFLPPRMTNAQRLAIASPAIGLMVYCTDMVEGLYVNKSTGWTFII